MPVSLENTSTIVQSSASTARGGRPPRHLRALEPAPQRTRNHLADAISGRCPIDGAEREREVQQHEEDGVAEAPRGDAGDGPRDGGRKGREPGRREVADSPCDGGTKGQEPEHDELVPDSDGTEPQVGIAGAQGRDADAQHQGVGRRHRGAEIGPAAATAADEGSGGGRRRHGAHGLHQVCVAAALVTLLPATLQRARSGGECSQSFCSRQRGERHYYPFIGLAI